MNRMMEVGIAPIAKAGGHIVGNIDEIPSDLRIFLAVFEPVLVPNFQKTPRAILKVKLFIALGFAFAPPEP